MVQRLGFDGYRAFQNYLHDLSIANATSLDGMQNNDRRDSTEVDPLRVTLEQDVKENLNELRNGVYMVRLMALARKIHSSAARSHWPKILSITWSTTPSR